MTGVQTCALPIWDFSFVCAKSRSAATCISWIPKDDRPIYVDEITREVEAAGLGKKTLKRARLLAEGFLLSDAELFANRSVLFTNGGEFRYAPL